MVDADVGGGAGTTTHPRSVRCREFLDAVLASRVRLAWSGEIEAEWRRHRSLYARRWLAAMVSKRRVIELDPDDRPDLVLDVKRLANLGGFSSVGCVERVEKDLHLVRLALDADRVVASMDEKVRTCLVEFASADHLSASKPLRSIVWVNPEREDPDPIEWVKAGCPDRKVLRLGACQRS